MKRENNDDGPHVDKRSRRNDDQIRILIPSNVSRHFAVAELWSHHQDFQYFNFRLLVQSLAKGDSIFKKCALR